MFGPKDVYEFTTYLTQESGDTIQVHVNYPLQLYGYKMETIVITFVNRETTVDTTYGLEMVNTQFTFVLDGKEVDSHLPELETAGLVTWFIFLFVAALVLAAGVFGHSTGILLELFGTLQLVHVIPIARLYLPTGLYKFFKTFES